MRREKKVSFLLTMLSLVLLFTSFQFAGTVEADGTEKDPFVRAFWVQAFEPGVKTPEEIDKLVEDVSDANMNTIIAQVSRRHDAYYQSDYLPFTQDPAVPEGFDPLGYMIEKGKEQGIEVHAWIVLGPMWHPIYGGAPEDENHIWNQHGPHTSDEDTWVTKDYNGNVQSEMQPYVDFGHPDARNHAVRMVIDIVENYDVDGVHLDYIRYQEDGKGYNPTSLNRFQEETGRSDRPQPSDEEWITWKVKQIDSLLQRIYLEMMEVDLDADLTAAVLSWGFDDPRDTDWWDMDPVQRAHQNWKKWVQEGYLDYAYVMNYDSDTDPIRANRFDTWIEWQKDLERNRGIVIGPALYLNTISDSMSQIRRAIAPSPEGNMAEGVSPYVYNVWSNDGSSQEDMVRSLHEATEFNDGNPPFTEPVPTPERVWKTDGKGHLLGQLESGESNKKITIRRGQAGNVVASLTTDGNGYFGITDLNAGMYFVEVEGISDNEKVKIEPRTVTSATLE